MFRRSIALATALCAAAAPRPPIRHVFVIVLENQGYDTTFGNRTPATYLADTMVQAGALLRQYYATGHFSLDNYIAMISGIAPDSDTQLDCGRFTEFVETGVAPDGQPIGHGCVYPNHVETIANQLTATRRTWRAYMEDMGNDPNREPATCGHVPIGASDTTQLATPKDQYAAKHDPFVYFHAIIDTPDCRSNVVSLDSLAADLADPGRTANFVFIAPSLCHDGHDKPCVDSEPGGLVSANAFLERWVPVITHAAAFREDGLLIVTFDESWSDSTACCNEISGPNVRRAGLVGPGGGRVGAVLLSPFIKPGTISNVRYNHYALLKSIDQIFGLPLLGYAKRPGLSAFGSDVYTNSLGH